MKVDAAVTFPPAAALFISFRQVNSQAHGESSGSEYFFSYRAVGLWTALDRHTVDAPSGNALKGILDKLRKTRTGFLSLNPLRPWPYRTIGSPVRPHRVRYISAKKSHQQSTQQTWSRLVTGAVVYTIHAAMHENWKYNEFHAKF